MKAAIVVSGSSPILVLTTYEHLDSAKFAEKLERKGIKKYIALELPLEMVKERYGHHYDVIMEDLKQTDDLRVLDYDGHHVYLTFKFSEMGKAVYHEEAP